jgi:uncharacterized membrane protein
MKTINGVLSFLILIGAMFSPALAADATYPAKTFDDGKARFYQYQSDKGTTIRYFIVKSSDGVIRAAFDACDVCWKANKGYQQKDDLMICRNCGRKFPTARINEVSGGCNPAPLAREIRGDIVTIREKDLKTGAQYFTFTGGRP